MRSRKASRPATDRSVREPRRVDQLGRQIDAEAKTTKLELQGVDQIKVGARHRKDMGDIAGLAANIDEVGLLHPIVVRPDGTLIAGERRLRAAQLLGWKTIPVTVIDLDDIVRGEFAENALRKDFTLSEAVAIKRALEPLEKAAAKERHARRQTPGEILQG